MAAWYVAALLPLAVWLGPQLAQPEPQPDRECTANPVECFHWSASNTVDYVVLPILLSGLVVSLVTLAFMVRRGGSAMATGTVAALTGWLASPLVLLLLLATLLLITRH